MKTKKKDILIQCKGKWLSLKDYLKLFEVKTKMSKVENRMGVK